jgi:hypothetical protein
MDLNVLAYGMLGLSLLASAVKMGGWILNADPRAIIHAGRWALLALAGLAIALLVWLVTSGRYSYAMMLAAFMLPVIVQAAPRWRVFLGPLDGARSGFPPITPDFSAGYGAGMSIEKALDVLGLGPTASAQDISDAHRRLQQKLDPKLGGSLYLTRKIDEARDVLLSE